MLDKPLFSKNTTSITRYAPIRDVSVSLERILLTTFRGGNKQQTARLAIIRLGGDIMRFWAFAANYNAKNTTGPRMS